MEDLVVTKIAGSLTGLDVAVLAAAIGLLLVIGYFAGRGESDTDGFFLGNRRVPTIIACLSFVATEISAVTIVAVPATAYSENWNYLQFFIGSAAARVFVCFVFIPVFYRHTCTSIYQFLRDRFGPQTQYAGSLSFFVLRLMGSGIRLYVACMSIGVIMGWTLWQALLLFSAVSVLFIAIGGIKAVVWNGAYQAVMFFLAGGAVAVWLFTHVDGGLGQIVAQAGAEHRLDIFNFPPPPWLDAGIFWGDAKTFWAGSINAFFVGLAVFGTDQELVQRLLTVRTRRNSQHAILGTMAAALPLLLLYLSLGTLLYVFFRQNPGLIGPGEDKAVLSHFVSTALPAGLRGLMLSAIVLASIDSPLSSLSTSFVTDIYRPLICRHASERHYLWVGRACVIAFGVVLAGVALAVRGVANPLWFANEVFSVAGGGLLGVFLLGILTRRHAPWASTVSIAVTGGAMLALDLMVRSEWLKLGWSWFIVIGTLGSFVLTYLLSFVLDRRPPKNPQPTGDDRTDNLDQLQPVQVESMEDRQG
jgi:SSS family transporter